MLFCCRTPRLGLGMICILVQLSCIKNGVEAHKLESNTALRSVLPESGILVFCKTRRIFENEVCSVTKVAGSDPLKV